jgi:hypothetical protein
MEGRVITAATYAAILLAVLFGGLLHGRFGRDDDALVHNERVKLAATALNNLGVAAFIYGCIAPTVLHDGTAGKAVLGFALCANFIGAAQLILRLLRPPPQS